MAGVTRKTSIQFGNAGPTSAFGQFGSKEAGLPQTSQDPAVIQGLSARWQQGWQSAVVAGDKAAYIQDMNGFCFVDSWQITYILQMGIPEWDSGTLYFTGSIVQTQTNGQRFQSLQGGVPGSGAGQSGNIPPASASNAFWLWINPPQDLVGSATLNTVQKVTTAVAPNGAPGSVVLGDSAISEDGVDVIISLPLKFPDNSVQSTAANSVSSQNVVTGSRGLGTVFHNTSTRPLWVMVTTFMNFGATYSPVLCDANPAPSTIIGQIYGQSGDLESFTFIVLPGYYYKVTNNGMVLQFWTEWS